MKKKTFIVQLLDSKNPNKNSFTQVEDALFYSNDTDASLVFIPHEDTFDFESAKVVMFNLGDESLVERDMVVTTEDGRKVASYELPDEIISHWGEWVSQPVFSSGGEIYSGAIVPFSVERHLMHERPPKLTEVVTVTKFVEQSQELVNAMIQAEAQRITEEQVRQDSETNRVQAESERSVKYESYAQQFNDVITDLSEEKDYHSLPEIAGARRGYSTLSESLQNLSVNMFNPNLGKLTQIHLSDDLLAQIAGNAAVNAVPANGSLTTAKYANKSITTKKIGDGEVKPKNTSFAKTGNNLANFTESGVVLSSTTPDRRTPYGGGWVSDLIPVETGDVLTLKYINRYMLYSESLGVYDNKLINGAETTITIPNNVAYIIVDTFGGFTPLAMVNIGAEALPYEPYSITIDNLALPEDTFKQSWEDKRVDWIGDSLLEKNSTATKNTYDYVTEDLHLNSNNLGVSGTGYANKAGTKTTFYERALTVRPDADLVVFCGSGNDISTGTELGAATDTGTTTIAGCINTAIDNALETAPLSKVAIITSPPWQSSQLGNDEGTMFGRYISMVKQIAYNRGIDCLDMYHKSGLRPWEETFRNNFYKHDNGGGTHPDEDGHYKFMYPPTREFIKSLL